MRENIQPFASDLSSSLVEPDLKSVTFYHPCQYGNYSISFLKTNKISPTEYVIQLVTK